MSAREASMIAVAILLLACGHGRGTRESPACSEFWPIGDETREATSTRPPPGDHRPVWSEERPVQEATEGRDFDRSESMRKEDQNPTATLPPSADSGTALERVARDLAALRRANSGQVCEQAAVVLDDMGLAVGELGGSGTEGERTRHVASEAALRTRSACGKSFEAVQRMQEGLTSILEAVEQSKAARDVTLLPWITSARDALSDLTPGRPTSLQRSVLQDALRTTYDALLVASLVGKDQPTSETPRGVANDQMPSGK